MIHTPLSGPLTGVEDRVDQAGGDVVDVPGDGYAWGDRGGGAETLDVVADGRRRIENGVLAQGRVVGADRWT